MKIIIENDDYDPWLDPGATGPAEVIIIEQNDLLAS
jgi:hypothetical protein